MARQVSLDVSEVERLTARIREDGKMKIKKTSRGRENAMS
jgi:hypothetical protein